MPRVVFLVSMDMTAEDLILTDFVEFATGSQFAASSHAPPRHPPSDLRAVHWPSPWPWLREADSWQELAAVPGRGDGWGMCGDEPVPGAADRDPSQVEVWRYRLEPRGALNARDGGGGVEGVLVRVAGGVGCLQPWPSLGDDPLDVHLAALAAGRVTPLAARALECARTDGQARRGGRWLFAGLAVPPSHAILPGTPSAGAIVAAAREGVGAVEVKAGPEWRQRLEAWAGACALPDVRLRLDFNETLDPGEAAAMVAAVARWLGPGVDFIEDPCPFDRDVWARLESSSGLRLAADRACARPGADRFLGVLKPAVEDADAVVAAAARSGRKLVVTTNMDHPVGQLWAAWHAARAASAGVLAGPCGLLTHTLFAEDEFSRRLSVSGGVLIGPPGTGLGYDDLVQALPWRRPDPPT